MAESLEERLARPGFSPRKEDAPVLFELLASPDKRRALRAERALARLGAWAGEQALQRLPAAAPPLRGRLARLLGRVAARVTSLQPRLIALLDDADPKTRRNAIIAVGKLPAGTGPAEATAPVSPALEQRLLARWEGAPLEEQRSLAASLGKQGSALSLPRLRQASASPDPELRRLAVEATLKIERSLGRNSPGAIEPERCGSSRLRVIFHCRAGLEALLEDELGPELSPRVMGPARVEARWAGKLARLQEPRLALRFGFPVWSRVLEPGEPLAEAVADLITSPAALAVFRAFTAGRVRFRLEWVGAGHRRALTYQVAAAVARRAPELVNDPSRSLWEISIRERNRREQRGGGQLLEAELWPRGLQDPRFAYRRRDLPAASHPTLAAALARVGGVREDDVCWDPFVGSGTELIERGLLGGYASLHGSDLEPQALAAARENLTAAGLPGWQLGLGDARTYVPPERPSLIICNPPMGRRLLTFAEVERLLGGFLRRAAELLRPGGRLAWISPLPGGGPAILHRAGLRVALSRPVDMGGFRAELQLLRRR